MKKITNHIFAFCLVLAGFLAIDSQIHCAHAQSTNKLFSSTQVTFASLVNMPGCSGDLESPDCLYSTTTATQTFTPAIAATRILSNAFEINGKGSQIGLGNSYMILSAPGEMTLQKTDRVQLFKDGQLVQDNPVTDIFWTFVYIPFVATDPAPGNIYDYKFSPAPGKYRLMAFQKDKSVLRWDFYVR